MINETRSITGLQQIEQSRVDLFTQEPRKGAYDRSQKPKENIQQPLSNHDRKFTLRLDACKNLIMLNLHKPVISQKKSHYIATERDKPTPT